MQPILQSPSTSVKAHDYDKKLMEYFADLYLQSGQGDVFIICGRNHDVLRAHRYVLSFASTYFRDALQVAKCQHPVVVLEYVSVDMMVRMLQYMYLGRVTLKDESELKEFVSAAKYLMVTNIQNGQYFITD